MDIFVLDLPGRLGTFTLSNARLPGALRKTIHPAFAEWMVFLSCGGAAPSSGERSLFACGGAILGIAFAKLSLPPEYSWEAGCKPTYPNPPRNHLQLSAYIYNKGFHVYRRKKGFVPCMESENISKYHAGTKWLLRDRLWDVTAYWVPAVWCRRAGGHSLHDPNRRPYS